MRSATGHAPLILSCSPRRRGNSDAAAALWAECFARQGVTARVVFLREHPVLPCTACGSCGRRAAAGTLALPASFPQDSRGRGEKAPCGPWFGCPQTLEDESAPLFEALAQASRVCLVAPIYFYHVPAHLKALLDRTQPFWELRQQNDARLALIPDRTCYPTLIAGRPHGDRLFEGSLLSLRYALAGLNLALGKPLLLRGLDGPDALVKSTTARAELETSALEAAGEGRAG